MQILILGGTEFTGPHTVKQLLAMGHEVTVFHRGSHNNLPAEVNRIHGDKDRLSEFTARFRKLSPDVVINMLAFTAEDAWAFVSTFRGISARVVVISSIDVYRAYGRLHHTEPGPPDPVPLTETSPLREKLSIEGVGADKTAVERIVMNNHDLPATVLRFPAVYGPRDSLHRLFRFIKRMDDKRPTILLDQAFADWRFTHGFVEDVAYATTLAATRVEAEGRVYNVGDRETPRRIDWIRRIGQAAGWSGEVITASKQRLPEALRLQIDFSQDWVVDTSRIRRELGFREQTPQTQALMRTVEWERANPPADLNPEDFDYAAEDKFLQTLAV